MAVKVLDGSLPAYHCALLVNIFALVECIGFRIQVAFVVFCFARSRAQLARHDAPRDEAQYRALLYVIQRQMSTAVSLLRSSTLGRCLIYMGSVR